MKRIKEGERILVSAELFDELLHAGLLAQLGTDGPEETQWPVWGIQHKDGTLIECEFEKTHRPFVTAYQEPFAAV